MNKIFLTQDGEVLRVQKRGQILLTLNAKENGNAAVAKRWEDVEDLRVTANIPNVSGIVRLPHTFDGSDMTIAAHYEWHDCNVMVIGNLGGVPFEFNIELKVDATAAETTSAIVEVPALDAGGAGGSAGGGMVEVTHAQLKAMRDAGQLVAGQQYRITDYVATTTDPESRSANHPFDIIVTADNERTLNESARAIAHEGDTYFEKCNLAAWQLMYCIDNDKSRFAWAQEGGEFYIVSFFGNSLKAELFSTEDTTHEGYPYRFVAEFQGKFVVIYSPELSFNEDTNCYLEVQGQTQLTPFNSLNKQVFEDGKGVIFRMIDENNNDMPYDFKGIQFKRYKITNQTRTSASLVGKWSAQGNDFLEVDLEDFRWCYLFNVMLDDLNEDNSVGYYLGSPTNGSIILDYYRLPNAVFMQDLNCDLPARNWQAKSVGWTVGNNCYNFKCGENTHTWICGDDCHDFTCGNQCYMFTIGNNCNTFNVKDDCDRFGCGDNCEYWNCEQDNREWWVGDNSSHFNILSLFSAIFIEIPSHIGVVFVSKNNAGDQKVWNPADLVQ